MIGGTLNESCTPISVSLGAVTSAALFKSVSRRSMPRSDTSAWRCERDFKEHTYINFSDVLSSNLTAEVLRIERILFATGPRQTQWRNVLKPLASRQTTQADCRRVRHNRPIGISQSRASNAVVRALSLVVRTLRRRRRLQCFDGRPCLMQACSHGDALVFARNRRTTYCT